MKTTLILTVLLSATTYDLDQDEQSLRAKQNTIFKIFHANQTLAEEGHINTAIVYDTNKEYADIMSAKLEERGLNVRTLSVSEFEDEIHNYSAVYFTAEAQPDPMLTADNEIISIGENERHFNEGSLSIKFELVEDEEVMINVNRDQLSSENHQMREKFWNLEKVVITN